MDLTAKAGRDKTVFAVDHVGERVVQAQHGDLFIHLARSRYVFCNEASSSFFIISFSRSVSILYPVFVLYSVLFYSVRSCSSGLQGEDLGSPLLIPMRLGPYIVQRTYIHKKYTYGGVGEGISLDIFPILAAYSADVVACSLDVLFRLTYPNFLYMS